MPDKLTDNEIVKAYEFCLNNQFCEGCIANKNSKSSVLDCMVRPSDILDLINRLQAENERLKPFEDKIAEFNSHIRVENMLVFANSLEEWLEFCNNLKAEAYKECIEKIKKEIAGALDNNYKVKAERIEKHKIGENDEFISYCGGKIDCLRGLDDFLDNLLKETGCEQPILNDVKCIDCEYLELELPYAVCSKAYKGIVQPNDSCGKGKLEELVGEADV